MTLAETDDPVGVLLRELADKDAELKRLRTRVRQLARSRARWKERASRPATVRQKHATYMREWRKAA